MSDQHYRVSVGTYDLSEEELEHPVGQQVIKIAPVIAGAGSVGRIIAGVALVALAFAIIPLGIAAAGSGIATAVGMVGASLILGGVAQLLTPTPTLSPTAGNAYTQQTTRETELDPQKSYSFSGIQNTSRAGTPVPLIYGETIVGSVVISAGIDTEQVSA